MAPSRNVDSWKKRHSASAECSKLYAAPIPDVMTFKPPDLDEEDDKLEILRLNMDATWDFSAFDKISVVTPGMEQAPDVKFDVQFPTSFNFTEDIFTTDNPKDGERASTPIPMTPDSNRSFNLEIKDPPDVSTIRISDDAQSQTSDVFDDLLVDDPYGNKIPMISSENGIFGDSKLKDTADMIPDVVYSSSDSEEESADQGEREINKGDTSIQSTHHRNQPTRLSVEIDSEFSGSVDKVFKEKCPPKDDGGCDDMKGNDKDPETYDDDDSVPSLKRKKALFYSIKKVFKKNRPPKDDQDCDDIEDNDEDQSSDEDDIVPRPERKKTMFFSIRRRRSRDNDDPNFFEDFAEEFFTCSYFFKCLGECAIEEGCSNGKEVAEDNNDTKFVSGETDDDKPVMEMEEEADFDETARKKSTSALAAVFSLAWKPKVAGKAS